MPCFLQLFTSIFRLFTPSSIEFLFDAQSSRFSSVFRFRDLAAFTYTSLEFEERLIHTLCTSFNQDSLPCFLLNTSLFLLTVILIISGICLALWPRVAGIT